MSDGLVLLIVASGTALCTAAAAALGALQTLRPEFQDEPAENPLGNVLYWAVMIVALLPMVPMGVGMWIGRAIAGLIADRSEE